MYHCTKKLLKVFTLIVVFQLCSASINAQGNLLITPKRVVLDGTKRTEILNLANIGNDTATFAISFVEVRMKEDGQFEYITVPDSNQNFASKFVRIFPRSVTLPPNEAQTIKLQVQRAGEMQPGEYRSHLYFRAIPNAAPLGAKKKDTSTISISLVPVFGITLPVIIQNGENTAKVSISDLALARGADSVLVIKMALNRTGNMSIYGDIEAEHISNTGVVTKIGLARGIAIYAPIPLRRFQLPLDKTKKLDLHSGKLRISFMDQSIRPLLLAQQEISL